MIMKKIQIKHSFQFCRLKQLKLKILFLILASVLQKFSSSTIYSLRPQKNYYFRQQMQEYRPPSQNFFKLEANSFELIVKKSQDKLVITLQDYNDWIIYENEYTEDNCQDIHKKVDLDDIYFSLTEAVQTQEEEKKQSKIKNLLLYDFDSVINKNNVPFFSIKKNGMMKIYVSMIDKRKGSQVIYQSNLKLVKKREMTQIQIVKKKSFLEKWYLMREKEQIQKTIQASKEQKMRIKNQTDKILRFLEGFTLITAIHEAYQSYLYYKIIPFQSEFNFKVKITKVNNNNPYIGIGIFDIARGQKPSPLYNSGQVAAYYCWSQSIGVRYPGQASEGPGYKQDQIISICMNLSKGEISWSCNGKKLSQIEELKLLKQKNSKFMPYVEIYYKDTSFEWLI